MVKYVEAQKLSPSKITIIIAAHKKYRMPEDPVYLPLHVGAEGKKDEEGNLLKGGKRHPDVGNHVILYANATILGGDTIIDNNSVVPTGSLILQTPEKFK